MGAQESGKQSVLVVEEGVVEQFGEVLGIAEVFGSRVGHEFAGDLEQLFAFLGQGDAA